MIAEPVTTLTDFLLAIECFVLGHFLFWKYAKNSAFKKSWGLGFFMLGTSALMGGLAHGGAPYAETVPLLLLTWPITIFSIVTTSFFLHLAWIEEFFPHKKKILFIFLGSLTAFFYLHVFGILHILNPSGKLSFFIAILSYAPAILIHLFLNLLKYLHHRKLSESFICNGIILSLFGTLIQTLKIAPHPHFNHNDLYHIIQMASIAMLYQGIKRK